VFLVLLIGADQFLRHAPVESPGLKEFRAFYLDLTRRIGSIGFDRSSTGETREMKKSPPVNKAEPPMETPRYFYVDRDGELQFAHSLEEIPPAYRGEAHPLSP